MKVFLNTEMLPVVLMNYLQSRGQKCHRVSTAFVLTSRRTEIVTSASQFFYSLAEGPNLRYLPENQNYEGSLAENALVQSCMEREILVI